MKMAQMNWLITGGCGFIGTNLIEYLICRGYNVRVLDNLSQGTKTDLSQVCNFVEEKFSLPSPGNSRSPKVELVVGDIREYETCLKCHRNIDVVVHLAANAGVIQSLRSPKQDMEVNIVGTLNMLEASKENGIKKFVFASSGAALGDVVPPIHEELAASPISPYGASKLACEGYCSAYFRSFGLKSVSLRFGNVYGPRSKNKDSVVAKFFRRAFNSEPLEIHGDGSQTRDFVYVEDLIEAIMASVRTEVSGEVFQIASSRETAVKEVALAIKILMQETAGIDVMIRHIGARPGDVGRNYSDISKATKILGYRPKFDLYTGLRKTLSYFESIK